MNAKRYHLDKRRGIWTFGRHSVNPANPMPYIRGNSYAIRPAEDTEADAEEGFVDGYYSDSRSPLEDAFGCISGVSVLDVTDDAEIDERDDLVLGFEDEDPINRALAMIATNIMDEIDRTRKRANGEDCDDEDVGMIVLVKSTDSQDFGTMVYRMTDATSLEDLQEILEEYPSIPGTRELAKACAEKMAEDNPTIAKSETYLRLVS